MRSNTNRTLMGIVGLRALAAVPPGGPADVHVARLRSKASRIAEALG